MKAPAAIAIVLTCLSFTFAAREALTAEVSSPVALASRVDLFNGRDFSGWTFCMTSNSEPSKTWSVTNGVLHCTGRPNGYARTAESYRDYKLTVEWRFVKVGPRADNGGILVHVQSPDKVWPKCIECQGQNQHQGDLILVNGAAFKGYPPPPTFRIVPAKAPPNEKPLGEWNTYEIVAAGDSLKVYVNGKLMNEAEECSVSSGPIAIQSEGGEMEIRKIYLEPAKAP